MNLPAGRWLVRATATVVNLDGSDLVECLLESDSEPVPLASRFAQVRAGDAAASSVSLVGVESKEVAGSVSLNCEPSGVGFTSTYVDPGAALVVMAGPDAARSSGGDAIGVPPSGTASSPKHSCQRGHHARLSRGDGIRGGERRVSPLQHRRRRGRTHQCGARQFGQARWACSPWRFSATPMLTAQSPTRCGARIRIPIATISVSAVLVHHTPPTGTKQAKLAAPLALSTRRTLTRRWPRCRYPRASGS